MRVFLDDMRDPLPDEVLARNYEECITLLKTGEVEYLSLDHDLGPGPTGYDVACWIENEVAMNGFEPPFMECHSGNPVGARNIREVIRSIQRLQAMIASGVAVSAPEGFSWRK